MESFEEKLKRLKKHFSHHEDDVRIEPVSFLSKVYKALREKYLGKIEMSWENDYYEYQYYKESARFHLEGIIFSLRVNATRCAYIPISHDHIFSVTINKSNINVMVDRISRIIDDLLTSYDAYQRTMKKLSYYGNIIEIVIDKYQTDIRYSEPLRWNEFYYWSKDKARHKKSLSETILPTINTLFNNVCILDDDTDDDTDDEPKTIEKYTAVDRPMVCFIPKIIGKVDKNEKLIYSFGITDGVDSTFISTVDYNNFHIGYKMARNTLDTIKKSGNELVIIRGIPGSGKSTKAQDFVKMGYSHYEADMYFLDDKGNYNWDGSKIGNAHSFCYKNVKKDLLAGKNVVVANTFTKQEEMRPYIELCESVGIPFRVIRMTNHYMNVHNVPQNIVDSMERRFQTYDGEELVGANATTDR